MPAFIPDLPSIHFGLIGHRGVAGLCPENTLISFRKAKELGLSWIEFDVMPCKTGEWMVIHDSELERTTNGQGKVKDRTLSELKQLDAGGWFAPEFQGEKIPSLVEVLQLALTLNLHPNIEIKIEEYTQDLLQDLLKTVASVWPSSRAQPLYSSFNLELLKQLRNLDPKVCISYVLDGFGQQAIAEVQANRFQALSFQYDLLKPEELTLLQQAKIPVSLFTLNHTKDMFLWQEQGIQAFFTDRPDLLRPKI